MSGVEHGGLYGTAVATMGMLATAAYVLAMDNFGPITDNAGGYLGVLPDDLSHHLLRLIHGGSKYQAYIKTIKINSLSIIIQEVYRSSRFKNQPSFLDSAPSLSALSSNNIIIDRDGENEIEINTDDEESV